MNKKKKSLILLNLESWGIGENNESNFLTLAKPNNFYNLIKNYPATVLKSPKIKNYFRGLDLNQRILGYSALGGRDLTNNQFYYLENSLKEKTFFQNQVLKKIIAKVKKNNACLHLFGLLSSNDLSFKTLQSLVILAKEEKINDLSIHLVLDNSYSSGDQTIYNVKKIEDFLTAQGVGKIASLIGNHYAFDQSKNWKKTNKVIKALFGQDAGFQDPISFLEDNYKKGGYFNEIFPTSLKVQEKFLKSGDGFIFFNCLDYEMEQLGKSLFLPSFNEDFYIKNVSVASCLIPPKFLPIDYIFKQAKEETISQIMSKKSLQQLFLCESDDLPFFSYFNGHELNISGLKIITSSLKEKNRKNCSFFNEEIIQNLEKNISNFDFVFLSLSGAEKASQTGDVGCVLKNITSIDKALTKIVKICLRNESQIILTSSQAKLESLLDSEGNMKSNYSSNLLPLIIISKEIKGKRLNFTKTPNSDLSLLNPEGNLLDISKSILNYFELSKSLKNKFLF